MRGLRAFASPPSMSSRHRNLKPWGGGTRQYIIDRLWKAGLLLYFISVFQAIMFRDVSGFLSPAYERIRLIYKPSCQG